MALIDTPSGAQYSLSQDQTFRARVLIETLTVARDVYNEAGGTTGHAQRATLAKLVALDPAAYAALFAFGVAVQRTDGTPGTDGDIYSALMFLWNFYAGV